MSEEFDNGGSAFACKYGNGFGSDGATLLDWFAGQIAAGHEAFVGGDCDVVNHDAAAEYYYKRAAAMVRRKRQLERGEQ